MNNLTNISFLFVAVAFLTIQSNAQTPFNCTEEYALTPGGVSHIYWPFNIYSNSDNSTFRNPSIDAESSLVQSTNCQTGAGSDANAQCWEVQDPESYDGFFSGTEVVAPIEGIIIYSGDDDDDYGNQVIIYNADVNMAVRIANLNSTAVSEPQNVTIGTPIGTVGVPETYSQHQVFIAVYQNVDQLFCGTTYSGLDLLNSGSSLDLVGCNTSNYSAQFVMDANIGPYPTNGANDLGIIGYDFDCAGGIAPQILYVYVENHYGPSNPFPNISPILTVGNTQILPYEQVGAYDNCSSSSYPNRRIIQFKYNVSTLVTQINEGGFSVQLNDTNNQIPLIDEEPSNNSILVNSNQISLAYCQDVSLNISQLNLDCGGTSPSIGVYFEVEDVGVDPFPMGGNYSITATLSDGSGPSQPIGGALTLLENQSYATFSLENKSLTNGTTYTLTINSITRGESTLDDNYANNQPVYSFSYTCGTQQANKVNGCGNDPNCSGNDAQQKTLWVDPPDGTSEKNDPNEKSAAKDDSYSYEWYRNDQRYKPEENQHAITVPRENASYRVVAKKDGKVIKTYTGTLTITDYPCDGNDGSGSGNEGDGLFPPLCPGCWAWWFPIFWPKDPNDIQGPQGYGQERWIAAPKPVPYTIRFENDPELATAAAQRVEIVLPLPENVDPYSLKLGSYGFANQLFEIPDDRSFYSARMNVSDSLGVNVDVISGIDVTHRKAFWIFQAIDPMTGRIPTDAEAGFLPINDSLTHAGEGFVQFTILPQDVSTGDSIKAQAAIIFDVNEPILTNTTFNTLDVTPPVTVLNSTYEVNDSTHVTLSWTGNDIGSGIASYDVYMAGPEQAYRRVGAHLTEMSYTLEVDFNIDYQVYVVARDYAGNLEHKSQEDLVINSRTGITTGFVSLGEHPTFKVWPNPASDKVSMALQLLHPEKVKIVLHSILGEKLQTLYTGNTKQCVLHSDMQGYPEGVYLISLHVGHGVVISRRIIIQHD